jgi:hypothetical protein
VSSRSTGTASSPPNIELPRYSYKIWIISSRTRARRQLLVAAKKAIQESLPTSHKKRYASGSAGKVTIVQSNSKEIFFVKKVLRCEEILVRDSREEIQNRVDRCGRF